MNADFALVSAFAERRYRRNHSRVANRHTFVRVLGMSARLSFLAATLLSVSLASFLQAQEETPPSAPPVTGASPIASPASTTAPLSASVTPAPSQTTPQLTDVLFK